ncbi:MAG: hypothetical protein M3O31_06370 [Acidobacteriota bacterium]|nr:hypothetical protein [Acidobacteriota bacterium]
MAVNLKRLPPKQAKGVTPESIHLNSFTSTAGIIPPEARQPPTAHHDSAFFAERGILTRAESIARSTPTVPAGHHASTQAA